MAQPRETLQRRSSRTCSTRALPILWRRPERFFTTGRIRTLSDLAGLSDRAWGWDDDYSKLRAVSLEAIRAHPLGYAKGVSRTTREVLAAKYFPLVPLSPPPPRTILCELGCFGEGFVTISGRRLPSPSKPGEPIPTGHAYWLASTPDNRITTDWTVISRPRFQFDRPATPPDFERLSSDLRELMSQLPSRDGSYFVARSSVPSQTVPVRCGSGCSSASSASSSGLSGNLPARFPLSR